jgi:hypothetical protein
MTATIGRATKPADDQPIFCQSLFKQTEPPLYPDYPQLPEVGKVVNSGIVHAIEQGIERGVFDDSSAARGAFAGLKSGITEGGAWPRGTVYDRDGSGSIRPNSVLVPVGNGGYAVYRVRSNGTAVLRTTLNRRP